MKCDKAQEFFSDYIENTLDQPMTVALDTHLSGCEACSADVADLRSMWAVLDKVPQVEPPADFVWRTTTRLQNELLNRREAERAKPLPWWKRLTPVQSFSYVGIAAMLVVGLTIGVHNQFSADEWNPLTPIINLIHPTHENAPTPPVAARVTAPSFDAQVPGADGMAATVTITATSSTPNASVAVALLTPSNGQLLGRPQVVGRRAAWSKDESWAVPIPNGGARAAEIFVYSGNQLVAQKRLILPATDTQPAASLQNADPYYALQQIASRTNQAILVDSGLATPVTVDLTGGTAQQALDQAVSQIGARKGTTPNGVLNLSR